MCGEVLLEFVIFKIFIALLEEVVGFFYQRDSMGRVGEI